MASTRTAKTDWIDRCAEAVIKDARLPAFLNHRDVADAAKIIRAHYMQHVLADKPTNKKPKRKAVRKS